MALPRDDEIDRQADTPTTRDAEKSGVVHGAASLEGGSDGESNNKTRSAGWFHWHEPGTSKEERRLIFKLDFYILTYSCVAFFIKQLDQNNITNAWASGMQEELGFGPGNELSWMNTYFTIGTLIGSPFGNLAMSKVPPRFWLPSCVLAWSLCVLGLYKCNFAWQFYVLRFFIGLFEASAWPGIHYILGAWYRKSELGRRSAIFVVSSLLGAMFSGYLQAALYTGMNGRGGLSAWRWLFIFDFILGIPVVIYGFFVIPDTPHKTKAFWLSEWERQRAQQRIEEEGRRPSGKLDWTLFKRIFASWQIYAFSLGFCFWNLTAAPYILQSFTIYLRQSGYPIVDVNNIPTTQMAFNIVVMLSTGFLSDKLGTRRPAFLFIGIVLVVVYSVFTAWYVPHALRIFMYIISGVYGSVTPLLAGWINQSCGGDEEKRGFILGFTLAAGSAVVIPFHQYQWPSSQAPAYRQTNGWGSALAFVVALTFWTSWGIGWVQKWAEKREAQRKSDDERVIEE